MASNNNTPFEVFQTKEEEENCQDVIGITGDDQEDIMTEEEYVNHMNAMMAEINSNNQANDPDAPELEWVIQNTVEVEEGDDNAFTILVKQMLEHVYDSDSNYDNVTNTG